MSEGGALAEAFAMYDRIRLSPCHVTTLATGFVASAATLILQAGDERLITETACLMIHNGSDAYEGAHNDFQRWAKRARVDRELMYKIYDRKSGRGTDFWESKCAVDTFLTAAESVELGLADGVLPALAS
jgi:ATP-dependent Clp protease protease subunit